MKRLFVALCVALSLTACGSPNPGEGQASGGDNGWLWGIGGYLLGRSMSNPTPAQQVHHHYSSPTPAAKPVVTEQPKLHQGQPTVKPSTPSVAPKPSNPYSSFSGAGKTYAPSRPSFSTPSRSYGGGRR